MGLCAPSDIMKSKSNPDFLKKDRSCVSRQLRNIRSKVSLGSSPWVWGSWSEPTTGFSRGSPWSHTHPAPHIYPAGPVLVASSFVCPSCSSGTTS